MCSIDSLFIVITTFTIITFIKWRKYKSSGHCIMLQNEYIYKGVVYIVLHGVEWDWALYRIESLDWVHFVGNESMNMNCR